jgi:glycosyltransferase involved in cell wall biosynthesis
MYSQHIQKLNIYSPQEFSQSSYVITGITQFCEHYKVQYSITAHCKPRLGKLFIQDQSLKIFPNAQFQKVIYIDIIFKNHNKVKVGFDLYDLSDQFSLYALEHCDFIFKRNFENKYVDYLPAHYQSKLSPLGLTFRVYPSLSINRKVYLSSQIQNLRATLKWDRFLVQRLFNSYTKIKQQVESIRGQRLITQYEDFSKGEDDVILFQTRVFPNESQMDTQQIHKDRYRIIKLLRREFPHQFKGGFIPSPLAREKYSDAITNVPSEPTRYLNAIKKAKIVIYTRGLANSPAWKMAEYLSQGKVIIAEQLTAELPVPLEHGKEVLFFENDEQLIANIHLVLQEKGLAAKLSLNARNYFEEQVHPLKNIERILQLIHKNA